MRTHLQSSLLVLAAICSAAAASAQGTENEKVTLEGIVVDSTGNPIGGARIYLARSDLWYSIKHGYGNAERKPELLGMSQPDGRFHVQAKREDVSRNSALSSVLLAIPPSGMDLSVDWNSAWRFNTADERSLDIAANSPEFAKEWKQSRILRLPNDDVPIVGRIVREDGTPVSGARVRVVNLMQVRDDDLTGFLAEAQRGHPSDYDVARNNHVTRNFFGEFGRINGLADLASCTTDEDGRFELRRFGPNRIGWLIAEHETIVTERILVRSQAGASIEIQDGIAKFMMYPAQFERTVLASAPLQGTVVDKDTQEPIHGAIVESLFVQSSNDPSRWLHQGDVTAVTDKEGRYRLTGLPIGQQVPLLISSLQSPHLPAFAIVSIREKKEGPTTFDWRLKGGVWIEGTVQDSELKQPVIGKVFYFSFRDNPKVAMAEGFNIDLTSLRRSPFNTDASGRYKVPGLPGRGLVAFNAIAGPEGQWYPTNKGQDGIEGQINTGFWARFDTLPSPCRARQFNAVQEICPEEGRQPMPADITLTACTRLAFRLLDPNGEEISGALYSGAWEQSMSVMMPMKPTGFHIVDYDAKSPRRLIFCHLDRNLAGTVVLKGPQRGPVEVKLEPAGALVGRVVNDAGEPMPKLSLRAAPLTEGQSPTEIAALPQTDYRTTAEGRFEVRGLAPGVKYNIVAMSENSAPMVIVRDTIVESGETSDVGDVTPMPLLPPARAKALPPAVLIQNRTNRETARNVRKDPAEPAVASPQEVVDVFAAQIGSIRSILCEYRYRFDEGPWKECKYARSGEQWHCAEISNEDGWTKENVSCTDGQVLYAFIKHSKDSEESWSGVQLVAGPSSGRQERFRVWSVPGGEV